MMQAPYYDRDHRHRPLPGRARQAFTSLSLGKAGVRALVTLLAGEYGPGGVHVATVTVGGAVAPGGPFDPDRIAAEYWRLHNQRPELWEHEVLVSAAGTAGVR
jgi:hypothetical protein